MAIPANTIRHAMASRRIIPARPIASAGAFCSTVLLRFSPGAAPALTQGAWDRAAPSELTLHSALEGELEVCTWLTGGQPWRFAAGNEPIGIRMPRLFVSAPIVARRASEFKRLRGKKQGLVYRQELDDNAASVQSIDTASAFRCRVSSRTAERRRTSHAIHTGRRQGLVQPRRNCRPSRQPFQGRDVASGSGDTSHDHGHGERGAQRHQAVSRYRRKDRKSTRLNSSHDQISYAVF